MKKDINLIELLKKVIKNEIVNQKGSTSKSEGSG